MNENPEQTNDLLPPDTNIFFLQEMP